MKLLITASFSDFSMYFLSLLRAFNFIAALEHSIEICSYGHKFIWFPPSFFLFKGACLSNTLRKIDVNMSYYCSSLYELLLINY